MNNNAIQEEKIELLTKEEKIKCQLLCDVFKTEIEYSFNLNYRDDLTFTERVRGFKEYFEEMSQATIPNFFEYYGEDYFSESILKEYRELKKENQEKIHLIPKVKDLVETLEQLNNHGYLNLEQSQTLEKLKDTFLSLSES